MKASVISDKPQYVIGNLAHDYLLSSMSNLKLVIFDFDGTIADTMDLGLEIVNDLANIYGFKKVTREELIEYRNLNTREALKSAGISFIKLPFIARDFRRELSKRIDFLQPIGGMANVITHLHLQNYTIGIITSNSTKNVISFLSRISLLDMFHFIRPQQNLFSKNKLLKSILKNYKLHASEVLYIGDETRDIEAAKECNIPVASVCWGLNTKMALKQLDPDYLIDSPSLLLELINQKLSFISSNNPSMLLGVKS